MKKIISLIISVMMISFSPISNVCGIDDFLDCNQNAINDSITSIGLIDNYLAECSVGMKKVHLHLRTVGSEQLQEIGFKNLLIQRSSDCLSWTTETSISSLTISNVYRYDISDYIVWVNGGNYYRVTLEHYAKSYNSTEEYIGNTSNYVWVS